MRPTAYLPPAEAARLALTRAAALGTPEAAEAVALADAALALPDGARGVAAATAAAADALAALGLADRALPRDVVDGVDVVDGQDGPAVRADALLALAEAAPTLAEAQRLAAEARRALRADVASGCHVGQAEAEGGRDAYVGSTAANLARGRDGTPQDAAGMRTYVLPLRGRDARLAALGLALRARGALRPLRA